MSLVGGVKVLEYVCIPSMLSASSLGSTCKIWAFRGAMHHRHGFQSSEAVSPTNACFFIRCLGHAL